VSVRVDPAAGPSSVDTFRARILRSKDKKAIKDILRDVSADLCGQTLTAIAGASGSGKTTLLNVIARRVKDQKFQQSGSVTYDDTAEKPTLEADSSMVGLAYVLQQDVLLPSLTVRETLRYAADLRLSTTKT